MARLCLSLVCAPEVEERVLDLLLYAAGDEVFTSTPTFAHGAAHDRLSNAELVMGRARSVHIQILGNEEKLIDLLGVLQRSFAGTGLRYWASPIVLEGEIK